MCGEAKTGSVSYLSEWNEAYTSGAFHVEGG